MARNKGKKQKIGTMKTAEYRKFIKSYGWKYSHSVGDRDYYRHPELPGLITVILGKTYTGGLVKANIHQLENGWSE